MDEAFTRLRSFARNNNRGLTEVAESLVAGTLSVEAVSDRRRTAAAATGGHKEGADSLAVRSYDPLCPSDSGVRCLMERNFCSSRVAPVLGCALVNEETPRAHQGHAYRSQHEHPTRTICRSR